MTHSIVVTGFREWNWWTEWDWQHYINFLAQIPTTSSFYNWNGFNLNNVEPTSPAETFASRAISRGNGFDPNNPDHQKWESQTKQLLVKLYNAAHDDVQGTFLNSDGRIVTDAQLRVFLSELKIELSTDPIRDRNGNLTAEVAIRGGDGEGGQVNQIWIDMDAAIVTDLAFSFFSWDEALTFIVLHGAGHLLDHHFGAKLGLQPGDTAEDFANWAALELGNILGLPTPTLSELNSTGRQTWAPATSPPSGDPGPTSSSAVYGSDGNDIIVRGEGSLGWLQGVLGDDLYMVHSFNDGVNHGIDHTLITDEDGTDTVYVTGYSYANSTLARAGNDLVLGFQDGSSIKISNAFLGETVEDVIFADQSQIKSIESLCQDYYLYWS